MTTLIKNVQVVDGTGIPPFKGDVLIRDAMIIAVGNFPNYKADKIIYGNEAYLCPGFIDINASSDRYLTLFSSPLHANFITQGVTTILIGQCGFSLAPSLYGPLQHFTDWAPTSTINSNWRTVQELLDSFSQSFSFGVNIGTLVGHKVIREDLLKDPRVWRALTMNELRVFRSILSDSLAQGAFGFSTGLGYYPYQGTTYHELRALVEVVARYKGLYATHVRDEKAGLLASVQEAVRLAQDVSARVLINHLRPFIGFESEFEKSLAFIGEKGKVADVHFSTNPFSYSVVPLDSFLLHDMRGWDRRKLIDALHDPAVVRLLIKSFPKIDARHATIVHAPGIEFVNGMSVYDFAQNRQVTVPQAVISLLQATHARGFLFYENLNQSYIDTALLSDRALIASNSPSIDTSAKFYPDRAKHTFSLFLEKASHASLSIESAIARLTGIPARVMGLSKRGRLQGGSYADMVLLSHDFVPLQVWVNGQRVLEDGVVTARPQTAYGQILRNTRL
ncbi:MAG: hypothetical protein WC099_00370 [Candidatus Paceibacterota bacterium]